MGIDVGNQISGDYPINCGVVFIHEEAGEGADWRPRVGRGTWVRRRRRHEMHSGHAVLVDNDHGNGIASGDQVVEDKILMSLVTPTGFVFTVTVLQIQNRISFCALVISRRRIDEDSSGLASGLREIPLS